MGSENFVSLITVAKTSALGQKTLDSINDYILWYAKESEKVKYRQLYLEKNVGGQGGEAYQFIETQNGERRRATKEEIKDCDMLEQNGSRFFRLSDMRSQSGSESISFEVEVEGKSYYPRNLYWKTNRDGFQKLFFAKRIWASGNSLNYIRYVKDFPAYLISNLWGDVSSGVGDKIYVVQTNAQIIQRCLLMTTDPGDLVLDPTCGSGTTAYVAEQWGRRWITLDTSRVALALARTRIMSAKYPYYLLSDSPEGIEKEMELSFGRHSRENGNPESTGFRVKPGMTNSKTENDIKKGFVYKRVPHITLKSIANNSYIKEGMSREQIDAAISKHADTEILYDQPYADNKRIRVAGPFTVESLSPHRILSSDEDRPKSEKTPEKISGHGQFETIILDNLKKAGVQNTVKNERLKFDRLEPYAGLYIHGAGEYTEGGQSKRIAVCIGPEHGTVSPDLIKEASKEAAKHFNLLIVCGFAFDPHAGERKKELEDDFLKSKLLTYGNLTILLARMNPDLAMGDELLKKTGAGNLFMIFGEPDIVIEKISPDPSLPKRGNTPLTPLDRGESIKGEFITVEIKGLDVYDPTTGQIRSHSTDDIACWFIDTDYNEESFFVRHAYFSGADEPYEKLKKALKAEIDESAWATIYSTKSRPFPMPSKNKIAVKVINHYGDEVLKVYDVRGSNL
jgi:adenine-specific DNA-methyltransferase